MNFDISHCDTQDHGGDPTTWPRVLPWALEHGFWMWIWIWIIFRVLKKWNGPWDTTLAPVNSYIRVTHHLRPLVPAFRGAEFQCVKQLQSELQNVQGFWEQVLFMVVAWNWPLWNYWCHKSLQMIQTGPFSFRAVCEHLWTPHWPCTKWAWSYMARPHTGHGPGKPGSPREVVLIAKQQTLGKRVKLQVSIEHQQMSYRALSPTEIIQGT